MYSILFVYHLQLKTITQLRVSGMEMWRYWLGHFMVDCPQFWLVMLCGIIVVAAFQLPSMTQGGALFTLILFLIVYSPVSLLAGYCSSFLFDDYETAQGILGLAFTYVSKMRSRKEGRAHFAYFSFYEIFPLFTINFANASLTFGPPF